MKKTTPKKVTFKIIRLLNLIAVAILAIGISLPVKASPAPQTTASLTFIARKDAYVTKASPNKNYGSTTSLRVDGGTSARMQSYLFFKVTELPGPVTSAKLRVYVTDNGSSNGPALYGTDLLWTETDITWNSHPARITDVLANKGSADENTWIEYDVTSHVTANGKYSFILVADSSDGLVFSSREGAHPPELVVTATANSVPTQPTSSSVVLVGAGDISSCSNNNDEATAKLLDKIPGTVFTTGDNAYDSGTASQFKNCYDPTWGRHKSRTKPVPGNHEYKTSGASGYFQYFSNVKSYYAYDLGTWRVYALNSEIAISATSAQIKWLKADLAANPRQCALAYWHKPRWSSGKNHGSDPEVQVLWKILYKAGAELVINGHDHTYERFKPMNAAGEVDPLGLREFVVGTGGAGLYDFGKILATSKVRNSSAHGVLKLTLYATSYNWEFIPVAGKTFTDKGSAPCH